LFNEDNEYALGIFKVLQHNDFLFSSNFDQKYLINKLIIKFN